MGEIFLKIVNMSIAASWLIAAVILLRIVLKKAPKWISCALWILVAIRLLCPVVIESSLSLVPSADTYPVEAIYNSDTNISNNPYNWRLHTGFEMVDGQSGNNTILQDVSSGSVLRSNINIIACVWIIGMAVMIIYSAISYRKLKNSVQVSVPFWDNVRICDDIQSPFIIGIIEPVVYLPSSLVGETLENVLTHEAAHIKRHDHWWKPFGYLLLTVYWFNPLCWLAYILLCRDIEMACDEKVIRDMDNDAKAAYSQALLNCSFPRKRIAACPLAFGEVGVKERVKSVLNYKKPAFWIIAVAVVSCIVVGVCFMTNPKDNEPDLSFLNYENAISTLADMTDVDAIYYPVTEKNADGKICLGYVNGNEFAKYLDLASWKTRRSSFNSLPSSGSVEICIESDYRITIYKKPKLAKVSYNGEERFYRTHSGDYEKAVALVYSEARAETVDNEAISTVAPNEASNSIHVPDSNKLSLSVIENQLNTEDSRITVEWKNLDDEEFKFGPSYCVYHNQDGELIRMPESDSILVDAILYGLKKGEAKEITYSLSVFNFTEGETYRIYLNSFSPSEYWIDFTVVNNSSVSSIGGVDEPISAAANIRTDVCELYLKVLEDLWNVDPGLNGGISQIGIDLSGLTHLTDEEKESVMNDFASRHNLPYIAGTWEELCEQGYIDKDNLYWEDGLFFSIKTTEVNDFILDSTTFDAHKWRSGLGAYLFGQCTAQKNADGKWSYTVRAEMIS